MFDSVKFTVSRLFEVEVGSKGWSGIDVCVVWTWL